MQMDKEIEKEMARESHMAEVDKARGISQVQSALVIAKKFPRNEVDAENRIMTACKRLSLAEQSVYKYPRGGEIVTGPSIRLAEMLAQNWGNLDFGIKELERTAEDSVVEAFAWDLETNTRRSMTFTVPHRVSTKKGIKHLTDERDRYENLANMGARRQRACILAVIPGDIVEKAVDACNRTVMKGNGEPLIDRIKRMMGAFNEIGVTREHVEKKLGHKVEQIVEQQIAELQAVYNSIKNGQAKRGDFFEFGEPTEGGKAAELKEKLAQKKPEMIKINGALDSIEGELTNADIKASIGNPPAYDPEFDERLK